MTHWKKPYHWTAAMLLAVTGCGGPPTAAVSGRVEFKDGSPIVGAIRVIRFEPAEDTPAEIRKAASGHINDDGSFTLMTKRPGDGVYKGKYVVTFSVIKNPATGESLIGEAYSAVGDTPFKAEVTADKSDYLFQLDKL